MVCIASFFVLLILSAVSGKHRKLLRKGWHCFSHRVTFRPCDTTFREEIKTSLLAPLALRAPRAVRPASVAIEVGAWVTVVSMVITTYIVLHGALNLVAFGTCNRQNPEACVLGGQVCGAPADNPTFWESLTSGDVVGAVRNEATAWGDTFQALPNRFRNWDGADYVPPYASFRDGWTEGLPIAIEVIDPGCVFCAELSRNIAEAELTGTHNVAYLVYPILFDGGQPQFRNSPLVARWLAALQIAEHGTDRAQDPADWFILDRIFAEEKAMATGGQFWLNEIAAAEEVEAQLRTWLREHGYTQEEIDAVEELVGSQRVTDLLDAHRAIVEDRVRTVTIPTFIGGGSMHRGVVSVEDLQRLEG